MALGAGAHGRGLLSMRTPGWAPPRLASAGPGLCDHGPETHSPDCGGRGKANSLHLLRKPGQPQPLQQEAPSRPCTCSRPKNRPVHLDSCGARRGAAGGFAGITRLAISALSPRPPLSQRLVD